MRREDQDGVAGVEERLAEELLEDLGPAADDDVVRRHRDAELAAVILGQRLAEFRQTERRAVVGRPGGDGLGPAARALLVLGKGLSPICSSMTSLPAALRRRATARTSKAVSADRPRAKLLSGTAGSGIGDGVTG